MLQPKIPVCFDQDVTAHCCNVATSFIPLVAACLAAPMKPAGLSTLFKLTVQVRHFVAAGAIGALYGPLHGGANEAVLRMLERIGKVENIPAFVEGVKNRKEKMFGFGHRSARRGSPCCSAFGLGHRSARKGGSCCFSCERRTWAFVLQDSKGTAFVIMFRLAVLMLRCR